MEVSTATIKRTATNPQTTPLTANTYCTVTGSGDVFKPTLVQFMLNDGLCCLELEVTLPEPAILSDDADCASVTYTEGLLVEMMEGGGKYVVLLSGHILDQSEIYSFDDKVIYSSA